MDTKTLLDLWNTRPVRPRSGKTIAGVCTGIARRYRIDPTIVKVAFLVAAFFGGAGVLLYIVGLITFPADNETAPRPLRMRRRSHRRGPHGIPWYAIVIGVIAVIWMSNMGSSAPFWGSGGLLGLALMLLGWWLLYQRTPVPPAGTSVDQLHPADSSLSVAHASPLATNATATSPVMTKTPAAADPIVADSGATTLVDGPPIDEPPAWDPLGAARFAWDLPEPTPPVEPPAPKPPRSPLTSVFAGLAVIAAVIGTGAHLAGADWFTVGRIAALALAVLGVGMLIDALQRRRPNTRATGLVWLAIMVGVVAVVATLAVSGRPWLSGGVGERSYHPQGVEQLEPTYELGVGTTTIDLRDVGPLDHDRTIEIRQGIGDVKVMLPSDIRVDTQCHTGVGDQKCPEGVVNADAKTPTLTVKADLNLGTVEMKK